MNLPLKKFFAYWIPAIILMIVIFMFSSIQNLRVESLGTFDFMLRKVAHMVEFGALAVLYMRIFKVYGKQRFLYWCLAFLMSSAYASTDEWHQTFINSRNGNPIDLCIDAAGALLALMWYCTYTKSQNKK